MGNSLIGAAGARIAIKSNEPAYIGFLHQDAYIDGQLLRAGAEVWFKPGLKIEKVQYPYRIAEDFHKYFRFPKELRHKIGNAFEANMSHVSSVESTSKTEADFHIANTAIVIPAGSWMRWDTHSLALRAVKNETKDWSPLPNLWVKKHDFLTFDIEEKGDQRIKVSGMSQPFEVTPWIKTIPEEEFYFWLGPNSEIIWAQMFLDNDTTIRGHPYKRGTQLSRSMPDGPITEWDYWVRDYTYYQSRKAMTPRKP